MIKSVEPTSFIHGKNYHYTRAYSDRLYRIPNDAHHNTVAKILDFGRNRMRIPSVPTGTDKYNLYEHIGRDRNHTHGETLFYMDENNGVGLGENRTWDLRRLLWDLVVCLPRDYWLKMREQSPGDFTTLVTLMRQFIDMAMLNIMSRERRHDIHSLFRTLTPHLRGPITLEEILLSPVRELYNRFEVGIDSFYVNDVVEDEDRAYVYRAKEAEKYGYTGNGMDALIPRYASWEAEIRSVLIWSKMAYRSNATTFLSDAFFNEFVIDEDTILTDDDVWMGERPTEKVLLPHETYSQ